MPVQIDEVSAEIEAPRADESRPAGSAPESAPEFELRKQQELLTRIELRARRVCAD